MYDKDSYSKKNYDDSYSKKNYDDSYSKKNYDEASYSKKTDGKDPYSKKINGDNSSSETSYDSNSSYNKNSSNTSNNKSTKFFDKKGSNTSNKKSTKAYRKKLFRPSENKLTKIFNFFFESFSVLIILVYAGFRNINIFSKSKEIDVKDLKLFGCLFWIICLYAVYYLIQYFFEIINYIYPCEIIGSFEGLPTTYKVLVSVIAILGGMNIFSITKFLLGFNVNCIFSLLLTFGCSLIVGRINMCVLSVVNGLDFYNKPVHKYEFVVNRASNGITRKITPYRGRPTEKDIWTYYLLLKPDIESHNSKIRRIEVIKSVYDYAEYGDDWSYSVKPGLLGLKHYSKNPHLINNHLKELVNRDQYIKGTEAYELNCKRMDLVSHSHSIQDYKKKHPNSDLYDLELELVEKSIKKINKRFKEMEIEIYRSLHNQ